MRATVGVATPEWVPFDLSAIPGDPVFTVLIGLVGVIALGAGVRSLVRYRRVRAPATPIISIDAGPVEVSGIASPRGDETLRSTFTDTPCLVCRTRIEAYYPSLLGDADSFGVDEFVFSDEWRTKHDETASVPFYVDDGTASVLVDPEGADLRFETHETTLAVGDSIPDSVREFVESAYASGDAPWARRLLQDGERSRLDELATDLELAGPIEWRFVEERLDVESPVHVLGVASPRRTAANEVGVVHAVVGKAVRRVADGGGRIDSSRRSKRPFVISDRSEQDVEEDLLVSAQLELGAGIVVLGLWSLYVLGYLPF
ncbi:MAG TPA: hypothetical protein VJ898_00475 [Natrialbaceae archaeon]|nr:hypothetical protein [Natrialbaceae archaeon]